MKKLWNTLKKFNRINVKHWMRCSKNLALLKVKLISFELEID